MERTNDILAIANEANVDRVKGIPCAVAVSIACFERPGSCSIRVHVAGNTR
jgi:hypothetical protein